VSHLTWHGLTPHALSIGVTFPPGVVPDDSQRPVLTDGAGETYQLITSWFTHGDSPSELSATFEVPIGKLPRYLVVGRYEIDCALSVMRELPSRAPRGPKAVAEPPHS